MLDNQCAKFRQQMFQGEVGLERECLRVTRDGRLADTPHPFTDDAYGRDFAECQLELVTPVFRSSRELYESLLDMHKTAAGILRRQAQPEYLWPCSNPPAITGEIPVARFTGNLQWKEEYRRHLAELYGSRKMLYSGIHYNFSFPREIIPSSRGNEVYLNLAKRLYEYAYIPVMLLAASPVYDASFTGGKAGETCVSEYASMRCGRDGYWNNDKLYLDFTSVNGYVASVQGHIKRGTVVMPSEVYLPVRLKSSGDNSMERLLTRGIAYVEFRMPDLNPFDEAGIDYRDLEFLHLFMIYLTFLEDRELTEEMQSAAMERIWSAALLQPPEALVRSALGMLRDMERFFAAEREAVAPFLSFQREKLNHPDKRYANRMKALYGHNYTKDMTRSVTGG